MGDGVDISGKENNKEEGEVMDTPDRSKKCQIATPISKFEESPVFNFLNNLSPIMPVKSIHISHSINTLSFASLPSVFTSPHVTSIRESRFLRRHQLSDPSKPEFSSDNQSTHDEKNVNTVVTKQLDEQKENVDPNESNGEEPSYDCSDFVVDAPEDYECNSPKSTIRSKELADYACDSSTFVQESEENFEEQEEEDADRNKEGLPRDWEDLINASDLLIFESPIVEASEEKNLCTNPVDGSEMTDNAETCDVITSSSINDPDEEIDYENLSGLHRGMRRRCLVFEMGGSRRKHFGGHDLRSDGNTSSNEDRLVHHPKAGNESSRCILPSIGLHLNALATNPKDYKQNSLATRRLLIGPCSSVDFHSSREGQELLPVPSSLERESDSLENAVVTVEDAGQVSVSVANEEINPSSPKKKRRRVEQAGDGETSCKRCNCKKSKCLKLYCECFAAGVYCVEPCACIDCFNKPVHEDTVLATRKQIESRNPLAFAPKVIRGPDSIVETGDDPSKTPASARHKRGCNCKKSGCLKKYCECYQGGVGCSINCRCEGCKNAFGRKDGFGAIGIELEVDEDETDMIEKSMLDRNFKCANENDKETNMDTSMLHATPLRAIRQSVQLPFSSTKKPPRSSFPSIGSCSSGFQARQTLGQSNFLPPPPKFDKQFETVREDEIPDFLQEGSPVSGVSPNKKRVSPPHRNEMSPGLRSSRKLILQSIPSFPSLTLNQ